MKIFKEKKYIILSVILKYSFVFIISLSLFMPVVFIKASVGSVKIDTKITNPLGTGNLDTLPKFIDKIIEIVITIGIPIVTLAIIYSGFLFIQAQGNKERLEKAKKALLYTLIGAALLLGAFVISEAIVETVEEIKS